MCIGLKMISAAAGTHDFDAMKGFEFRHKSSIEYVTSLEETCTTMLGITKSMIDETKRGSAIKTSENYYMTTLRSNNPVLGYYVVLLPCILTYWVIANRLMNDPKTAKNVVYHSAWTEVNDDTSSVYKYIKFINENIAAEGHFDAWSSIFKIACKLEVDMFKTGLNPPAAFKIIDDGIYSINVASGGFVLAIRDVADVAQQRSNKSLAGNFPTGTKNCVVGIKGTGASKEKWHISSTPSGYTIQNIGTELYIASKEKNNTGRILQGTAEPYYWWINPVKTKLGERSSRYQIYDTANLRFTLHAEIEMAASNDLNYISVVACDNTQSSSQMWTFDDGVERPAETPQTLPIDSQIAPAPDPANTGISAEHLAGELNKLSVHHDCEMHELRAHFGAEMTSLAKKHETEMAALRDEMANTVSRAIKAMKDETKAEIAQLIEYHERRVADAPDVGPEQQQTTPDSGDDEQDTKHGFSKLSSRPCHWERVTRNIFRAADYLHHIRYGVAPSRYIMRVQIGKSSWSVTDVGQGESCETDAGNREAWILVGHQPSLRWVSCHGRFKADSTGADLIPAWDSDSKGGPETMYIAMFTHAGRDYITHVKEGQNGVTKSINGQKVLSSKDYEVLSYKPTRRE
ncbi:heme oxygenase-like protein [Favolaschia claudopus]|uniref:Heme oxygenase-like protein n=1 Tax=Favolaschia claudopus TaxID=2862362 RepID=A0AAW0DGZ6_9AGAR